MVDWITTKDWLRWIKNVEQILGHSLDGDQDKDGYSLDFAYSFFETGDSPKYYADHVRQSRK